MYRKQTLFSSVYEDLKRQILTGIQPYGSKLPSAQQLCQFYDVGMRTIVIVMRALREEGFIQTTERGKATVIYSVRGENCTDFGAHTVLSHSANVLEVYQTMELLMPDMLAFYTGFFNVIELQQYDNALKWSRRPTKPGQWRAVSALIHDILLTAGNPLSNNLYATLESYAEIPFITEGQEELTGYSPYQEELGTRRFLDILREGSRWKRQQEFSSYYHRITCTIELSFSLLRQALPNNVATEAARQFSWYADRGGYPYYLQIAQDIIEKIWADVYPAGMYLPSEVALAKQYEVSEDTAENAIKYLNNIGVVHTCQRKGSYVIRPNQQGYFHYQNKSRVLPYLSSLQLMALAIRPAALLVFDALDMRALKASISQPKAIPLANIASSIIEHMPLQPYKVILRELNHMLNLGFYFSLYSFGKVYNDYIVHTSMEAFHHLERGDRQGFADLLRHCYSHILICARTLLMEQGLSEAELIVAP